VVFLWSGQVVRQLDIAKLLYFISKTYLCVTKFETFNVFLSVLDTGLKSTKSYIGITMVTLKRDFIFALHSRGLLPTSINSGVLVWNVAEGGPAFRYASLSISHHHPCF